MVVLPEPVGPVTMKMPLGLMDHLDDVIEDVFGQPEVLEIEIDGGAIEHAQHDGFAKCVGRVETRRSTARPAIFFMMRPSCGRRRSAMFRFAITLIREMTGERKVARRRRHFVERAVHPVADFELVLERLEVDVARAVLDRLIQDQVDEADDRGGVRLGFDICDRRFVAVECHQLANFAELLEDLLHAGGIVAIMLFQAFPDLLVGGKHHLDVAA